MDIFSVDFSLNELSFIRQALDIVSINGKDAKFLANLQHRVESEIADAQKMLQKEELKKSQELNQILANEQTKSQKTK